MTASVSASAATNSATPSNTVRRPRAFVPPIEFTGNIEKMKNLLKENKFSEVADTFIDNGLMPEFVFKNLVRSAPREIPESLLRVHDEFVLSHLSSENVEKRGKRMSALLRAAESFEAKAYFTMKQKLQVAIKAVGATLPAIVVASCEEIEKRMKAVFTADDWSACGFEVKSENKGQLVIYHPGLRQSITIYKKQAGPQSEAEKAKDREHKQGERRSRQLTRAALFPGKVGGGGSAKSDDGKKGKKK
jgi:hypothetical protein